MTRPHILAVVLAGGQGSRMDVLTRERAKPAMPFAGSHRLIDVPLSNLHHSAVDDVFVSVQYHSTSLDRVVANGRPWDLDRTRGGLRLMGPQEGGSPEHSGFASGNADVLLKMRSEIREIDPDVLIVCSADHVYSLDFSEVVATHLEHEAAATVVTTRLSKKEAVHHATVGTSGDAAQVQSGDRVTRWSYKPSSPDTDVVATEIFAYHPATLLRVLGDLHGEHGPGAEDGESGLGDFGESLIPRLIEMEKVVAHPLAGYWRDAGRPDSYLRLHRDIIAGRVDVFGDSKRPLLGMTATGLPAQIDAGAVVEDSLLSPGARVAGTVIRSVLGPDVRVEAGAMVVDSVVFAGCHLDSGAFVGTAIVDERVRFGRDARLGVETGTKLPVEGDISLVGPDCVIDAGVSLPAGSRLEPGTTA